MTFLGVYKALYDYAPQNDNELEIKAGELLYILDRTNEEGEEDDWWKARKKAANEEDDEPEGLVPSTYVEEATPISKAKSLYEYDRQTDEELTFPEGVELLIYDTSDPDWTLVSYQDEFGFAPANYLETGVEGYSAPRSTVYTPPETEAEAEEEGPPPPMPARPQSMESPVPPPQPAIAGPAASIASIMGNKPVAQAPQMPTRPEPASPPLPTRHVQFTPEASDEDAATASIPTRPTISTSPPPRMRRSPSPPQPQRHVSTVMESPPVRTPSVRSPQLAGTTFDNLGGSSRGPPANSSYHLYNISEMVSVMGKQKKMPVTLGINMATGMIMLSPEKKRDGPEQEWTADKLEHYSIEGKHVFLELKKPSKSLDLHAGAKDTALEIVSALGELAGAIRGGGGFDEVIQASQGKIGIKRGHMLYDFMAQGDDEVTVADGDEVIIVDDFTSDEWWKVRRLKNNKEGVVPSSYVEITQETPAPPPKDVSSPMLDHGRSMVEKNREEEARATRDAVKRDEKRRSAGEGSKRISTSGSSRDKPKSKPNVSKIRTWTDRSGSFKVEAQFIGLRDSKIHLHKLNGVKIAVPVDRMSTADLNYVEKATGKSLEDDKPLSDIADRKRSSRNGKDRQSRMGQAGASVEPRPDYDWFEFFLQCGVNPHQCERYAQAFSRDQMDESSQEDVTTELLRTLGLREGDILKVMKYLDSKYTRKSKKSVGFSEESEANGESSGLFSGPGGVLRNNTGKGRPAPPVQTNNTVDADAFKVDGKKGKGPEPPSKDGFADNAWDVKPTRAEPKPVETPKSPPPAAEAAAPPPAAAPTPAPPQPAINPDLIGLSLLDEPLQPVVKHNTNAPPASATPPAPPAGTQPVQPQPTGANPQFFQQIPPQQTGLPQQQFQQQPLMAQQTGYPQQMNLQQPQPLQAQPTALQQPLSLSGGRQRPAAPAQAQYNQGTLMAPPPARPGSAPQQMSPQNGFAPPAPIMPQLTGAPGVTFNPNANPGQSLQDMQRNRLQQQMTSQPMQLQPTGFQGQMQPQATGYMHSQPTASPFSDINRIHSPPQMGGFAAPSMMQPQMTGYQPQLQPQPTGMMQPLQPQQTGFGQVPLQPQQTGMNGMNGFGGFGPVAPPVPQIPQQYQNAGQAAPFQPQSSFGQQQQQAQNAGMGQGLPAPAQPLVPQKTGPAPPVSFGMGAKKLTAQPTGRADLSKATPQNPFGF